MFAVLTIFSLNTHADIIQVEGEMGSSVTAYITRRFSSPKKEIGLSYRIYFPSTFTESMNTQNISGLRKTFVPSPTEIREFTDEFGNTGADLFWNKPVRIVQLDLQFNANTYANFSILTSESPFPVTITDQEKIFLTSTELAPADDFYINYIGRSLSYDLNREIDVVSSIFLWLDKNIRLTNKLESDTPDDALSVLQRRDGRDKGLSNLAAALLKGMGIPVRVVRGLSFQKELSIKAENQTYIYNHPNGERFWVEVFFPDIGWVSYDPRGTHFGTTSHVIKLSAGPDSDHILEMWSIVEEHIDIQKEYIYDIKSDYSNIIFKGLKNGEVDKIVLTPLVTDVNEYQNEPNLDIEGLQIDTASEEPEAEITGMIFQNSGISHSLDLIATRNKVYAQKFSVSFPFTLTGINLPLIKFGDEGRIWIEIFADENGLPGKKLFRTYSINSPKIRYMMIENPWLSFPVGKKTDSYLQSGDYWLALRSSGNCIFNWYACEGNVIGTGNDTRYMDVSKKKQHWDNIMNMDLNFQIFGKRGEE